MVSLIQDPYILALVISISTLIAATLSYVSLGFINRKFSTKNIYVQTLPLNKTKWTLTIYILFAGTLQIAKILPVTQNNTEIINHTLFILTVLAIALVLTQVIGAIIHYHVQRTRHHNQTPKILDLIISIIIFTVAIITILQYFNVQITAIIATLGIGGIAIGLALQSTLANLFAGIHLITTEPVRVGDFIEIEHGGLKGNVIDIGWRETKIRQINNTVVIIPNNKLAESVIVNDSMPEEQLTCLVEVGVDYTSNLEHVEQVTLKVAKQAQEELTGAVRDWEPKIRFHTFADNNINFAVYLRVERYTDRLAVSHEFIKLLKTAYDQEQIEISWPIRKVYNK